jgi:hypothetical protein
VVPHDVSERVRSRRVRIDVRVWVDQNERVEFCLDSLNKLTGHKKILLN